MYGNAAHNVLLQDIRILTLGYKLEPCDTIADLYSHVYVHVFVHRQHIAHS